MTLPWSSVSSVLNLSADHYTIHGLKCTLLSWACQLGLSEEDRRQHGKHRPAQQSVALYSRDDVVGSLRLQCQLVKSIGDGWRPCTPLARGGQKPITEPPFQLEQFKKDCIDISWQFFQFDVLPKFWSEHMLPSAEPAHDSASDSDLDSSDSSESSASSASSSDAETGKGRVSKKRRIPYGAGNPKDQAFGLHRTTWHVMIPLADMDMNAPVWEDKAWKTACGRYLSPAHVCICSEFHITDQQVICSHAGCRKCFTCMDA